VREAGSALLLRSPTPPDLVRVAAHRVAPDARRTCGMRRPRPPRNRCVEALWRTLDSDRARESAGFAIDVVAARSNEWRSQHDSLLASPEGTRTPRWRPTGRRPRTIAHTEHPVAMPKRRDMW